MSESNQRLLTSALLILVVVAIAAITTRAHNALPISELCDLAAEHGNGVPPNLVVALIMEESGGQPDIRSGAGAVGLMQIIERFHPDVDLTDPAANIQLGTTILRSDYFYLSHIRLGLSSPDEIDWNNEIGLRRALRGYNMGPGNVVWYDRNPDKTEPEAVTRYADNIISLFHHNPVYCG